MSSTVEVDVWWFDARAAGLPAPLDVLDGGERRKAASFVRADDRRRYEVAHLALRVVLASYTGTPAAEVRFVRRPCPVCGGPSGRPAVAGDAKVEFSLSHTGDVAAVAVAKVPVGIDVEGPARGCVCELAAEMHPDDRALLTDLDEEARHRELLRWWARTEATLKCSGAGIVHGLGQLPVLTGNAAGRYVVRSVRAPGEHVAAVAVSAGERLSVTVRRF